MMGNFIEIYDNAMPPDLCQETLQLFENCIDSARPGVTGQGAVSTTRKNSHDLIITGRPEWNAIHAKVQAITIEHLLHYVRKYPSLLSGAVTPTIRDHQTGEPFELDVSNFDRLSEEQIPAVLKHIFRPGQLICQKYDQGAGGYHHWHWENAPRPDQCESLHRVLLFMFYLNDVEEGGETSFLYHDEHVSPVAGRMVIAPAGFTHTHKGHIPKSGDKTILTSWILFQRAETLYPNQP